MLSPGNIWSRQDPGDGKDVHADEQFGAKYFQSMNDRKVDHTEVSHTANHVLTTQHHDIDPDPCDHYNSCK